MEMTSVAAAAAEGEGGGGGGGGEEGPVTDMTLTEALKKWVAKHPDKRLWTYLDDRGQETSNKVTYRELDDRTRALSLNLLRGAKGRGPLAPGDRVLLVYPPSLHFSVAFVACLRAGLVAVPVYPPDPRKLRKDMQAFSRTAASCGAKVALTSSAYDHAKKYHDMGLIGSVLGTLYCGGSGYYLSPLDFVRSPPTWITAVDRFRATHLQSPSFGFALTVRKWKALKTKPVVDLSSVVHLINAAEPVDAASLTAFEETFCPLGLPEGVIKPTYGLAEHTVFVCSGGVQRITVDRKALEVDKQVKLLAEEPASTASSSPSWCKLVGCGYPARVKGLELLVVEPSSGKALPEDRVGEVWLRSASKAHGYWGLPERSREAFCATPSLATASVGAASDTEPPKAAAEGAGAGEGDEGKKEGGQGEEGGGEEQGSREEGADAVDAEIGGGSAYQPVSALELHSEAEGKGGGGSAAKFSEGYLRTGDEGFLHKGELFICGRIKDLVIVGGRNHYPQDLERTVERGRNEAIRPGCSAAFSVPGEEGGELLVLTAELREDQVKVSEGKRRELGEELRSAVVNEHGVEVHHLSPPPGVDPSTLTDEQLLSRLQRAVLEMGDGSAPDPDAPFYTLGLSSMTGAQFSGLLEQEYGAHVPLSVLDADATTLRSLVPLVKAGTGGQAVDPVAGVASSETMVRDSPGKCEETITNSCPCCLCLLSCPCCT
eukprot:g7081.t1